ncbi:MAG: RnfABCDGE type electron transport complex subunit D [Bacillota bacterium]|nr:RnfABCDGE type electron transport complex subunit D [Bacillota bacterium]
MNTFPLIRTKLSNEHIMAGVFAVLVLYMLPSWIDDPEKIMSFAAVLAVSLVLDSVINHIRFKKTVCSVSAAVTAGIYFNLAAGVPLWGQLLGITAALVVGKHIWGGTGKNIFNPAMVGILFTSVFFNISYPSFNYSWLLLPVLLLSLPFISFRPFASLGFIAGMTAAMIFNQDFSLHNFVSWGVVFWGCLVLTDPVTVSLNPVLGLAGSIAVGFAGLQFSNITLALAVGVVTLNLLSAIADRLPKRENRRAVPKMTIKKIIPYQEGITTFVDLTENEAAVDQTAALPDKVEILKRIGVNGVFGMGGAAFPTINKITATVDSKEASKHLIINAVECDPGLLHDNWIIRHKMDEISKGVDILKRCIEFESVTLAIKAGNMVECPQGMKLFEVPDYYPAGAERILINRVLGKKLSYKDIPSKKGVLVLNVQTVWAIYEAAVKNKKIDSRLITVADMRNKSSYIVKVRLGESIQRIADELKLSSINLFIGGGAMQCRNYTGDETVDNTINFIASGSFPRYKESPQCSRCGFCRANCPEGLMVDRIAQIVDRGDAAAAKRYKPEKCMQCGSCSRVCLAGRNLSARVNAAKATVRS